MKRLLTVLTASVIALLIVGCDKLSASGSDSAKAEAKPAPSADVNQAESHNALTESEDQASQDRRMKARESLGFKSPEKKSSGSSSGDDSN